MSFLARAPSPHPPTKTPTTAGFSTAVTREMQLKDTEKYSLQNQRNILLTLLLLPTTTLTTAGFTAAVTREIQFTESKKYHPQPPTSTYYDSHYCWFYWRYFLSVSSSTGGA